MIASLSGIRGIPNEDLLLGDVTRFAGNFAATCGGSDILVARDTRRTGPTVSKAVIAGILSRGARVLDCGVVSTPALFRESRVSGRPAIMVTASHNEPEFNGLKFIESGQGIGVETLQAILSPKKNAVSEFSGQAPKKIRRVSYVDDLVSRFGEGAFEGMKVALDLGGGAAAAHAVTLMTRIGCHVVSINGTPGVFSRKVDPVAAHLALLTAVVKKGQCDIGLAFDCDGDRLVIVDSSGKKRSGDFMLTLAMSEALAGVKRPNLVVSMDTTQAIDDVARKHNGKVFRSKVGEANVVSMMQKVGARFGGEGSSGGLIDGDFNFCRDSMLAALFILRSLKSKGSRAYSSVPVYYQNRVALQLSRSRTPGALKKIGEKYPDCDRTDGLKIRLSQRSWVLLRPSGTEDVVRVSAEAPTKAEADRISAAFAKKLKGLSK